MPLPVNAPSREGGHIIAFAEKRQDSSVVTKYPREFIVNTTRLDPMSYMLFGTRNVKVAGRGLECDEWLPVIGNPTALDQISRLKEAMDLCFLRVCEGIVVSQAGEGDGEFDDDDEIGQAHERGLPLSRTEIKEFESFTEGLVRILNRYDDESSGVAPGLATSSRPAIPEPPHILSSIFPEALNGDQPTRSTGSHRTRPTRSRRTRPTRRRSGGSSPRDGSPSEGHQSDEDDGESKKKVDWYD